MMRGLDAPRYALVGGAATLRCRFALPRNTPLYSLKWYCVVIYIYIIYSPILIYILFMLYQLHTA